MKGDETQGNEILKQVLALCQHEQSQKNVSYWVDFTAGAVYLALGNEEQALIEYKQGLMREPRPEAFERESAMKGAMRMATLKHISEECVATIKVILQ